MRVQRARARAPARAAARSAPARALPAPRSRAHRRDVRHSGAGMASTSASASKFLPPSALARVDAQPPRSRLRPAGPRLRQDRQARGGCVDDLRQRGGGEPETRFGLREITPQEERPAGFGGIPERADQRRHPSPGHAGAEIELAEVVPAAVVERRARRAPRARAAARSGRAAWAGAPACRRSRRTPGSPPRRRPRGRSRQRGRERPGRNRGPQRQQLCARRPSSSSRPQLVVGAREQRAAGSKRNPSTESL